MGTEETDRGWQRVIKVGGAVEVVAREDYIVSGELLAFLRFLF